MEKKRKVVVANNYIRIYEPILMAGIVLNTDTGIECEITVHDKMVYSYIYQQSNWFKVNKKDMFESQDSVAMTLGFDRKTVNRSIKKLEDVGLVVKTKKRVDDTWKNVYSAVDVLNSNFRLFAEIETRAFGTKPVKEDIEIVQALEDSDQGYMTASELPTKRVKQYNYSNDDMVLPF